MKVLSVTVPCYNSEAYMVISNFVYEKEGARHKKAMRYRSTFPQNKVFTWDDVKFTGIILAGRISR